MFCAHCGEVIVPAIKKDEWMHRSTRSSYCQLDQAAPSEPAKWS